MFTFLAILIIILSIALILIIIVQNPKGGGVMGSLAGSASNVIGVQRAGDILEKGTWGGTIVLLFLCILTVLAAPKTAGTSDSKTKTLTEEAAKTTPTSTPTAPTAPVTPGANPLKPVK
ncbi:MAG: preprotein translocase subunit SecG [Chitinophagales bacterium]|nr:preprotein translocase subunit SecG [Chitinophagales bacterium]